jgi:hypothetical protein
MWLKQQAKMFDIGGGQQQQQHIPPQVQYLQHVIQQRKFDTNLFYYRPSICMFPRRNCLASLSPSKAAMLFEGGC